MFHEFMFELINMYDITAPKFNDKVQFKLKFKKFCRVLLNSDYDKGDTFTHILELVKDQKLCSDFINV